MKKILLIIMVLATALACYGQKKNYNLDEVLQHAARYCYDEKLHEDTVSYYRNVSVFARTGKKTINVTEKYKKGILKSGEYIKQTPINPLNVREYTRKKKGRFTIDSNGRMYFIEIFEYKSELERERSILETMLQIEKNAIEKSYKNTIDSLQNEINRLKEERATIN